MNKFFDSIKSAFVITVDETAATTPKTTPASIKPGLVSPEIKKVEEPVVTSAQNSEWDGLNQVLLDKLCERLDSENLPGPDYMELKTAMNDEFIIDAVPDENKRFIIAFKSLQANAPQLTKEYILKSIDTYVGFLKKWEREALADVKAVRSEVGDKKQAINDLNKKIEELVAERAGLEAAVAETETKCNKNEHEMVEAVAFLVKKFNEDKEKINSVLK